MALLAAALANSEAEEPGRPALAQLLALLDPPIPEADYVAAIDAIDTPTLQAVLRLCVYMQAGLGAVQKTAEAVILARWRAGEPAAAAIVQEGAVELGVPAFRHRPNLN